MAGVSRFTVEERLAQLAAEHELPDGAAAQLRALLDCLADEHAPTTIRDPLRGVDAHVADALAGLTVPAVRGAGVIADIGAGAGVPGLVLAAALPDVEVHLVESVRRKAEFSRATAERMRLGNASVVVARVEEWADGRGRCDVVTARAVAALPVLCEYAAPLLRVAGHLVAWKGDVPEAERADGAHAASLLGLEPLSPVRVQPFREAENRWLYLYSKVVATPAGYPRRPGMATKRPQRANT